MASVQYIFTPLNALKIGETCNIFGLVKYCSKPEKTKGKDYKMTISITDISLGYDFKIICNLFNERPENFPKITGRGDVIIIHKLKISKYLEKPQGLGIQKQGYSVAVFSKINLFSTQTDSYEDIISKMGSNKSQFNITLEDLKKIQELLEWGFDMPSSEIDESEVNIETLSFMQFSSIDSQMICALAVQVISIISIDYLNYRSLLLTWDGTLPGFITNKKFIESISNSKRAKHHPLLMAKLGGKLSNPYIGFILMKEEENDLLQSFVQPGDYIYFNRISVESPLNGPGMWMVADRCKIGILINTTQAYRELHSRVTNFNQALPCVADCISSDLDQLNSWPLLDYGKILQNLETENNETDGNVYQFKITSRVVNVHPSTDKDFYDSIIFYCTCCQELKSIESFNESSETNDCRKNLVPVPMVTLVFEDFTGWFTGVAVGKAVMDMLNLVMIDASQPEWWVRLFAKQDKQAISRWLNHINRLKDGWIEAKLVFKSAADGKIIPFVEDVVILDY